MANNITTTERSVNRSLWHPYISHHFALAALLAGNLTFLDETAENGDEARKYVISELTTDILSTRLVACDEIANSPFRYRNATAALPNDNVGTFDRTFPTVSGMCRNQSLSRAIEDLANNITISYLSSPALTTSNTTFRNIETSDTINVYEYHPFFLLLSYGIGLLFTFVAALIGLYSVYLNGVSHSTSFSAIIATTRNSDLDALTEGSSLAAEPLQTHIRKAKLRFGPLLDSESRSNREDDLIDAPRLAFGLEEKVGQLRKGQLYR